MDKNKIDEHFENIDNQRSYVKRQNELVKKHPDLKPMFMNDPLARRWVEQWSRTDISIEDGLVKLAIHLYEARANTFARTNELAAKRIHVDDLVKNRAEMKINDDGSVTP